MTLTLILMRHAKSSWNSPAQNDHDRPLNARGVAASVALGHWLRHTQIMPDEAIISTARRTVETFEGLEINLEPTYTKALYHADAFQMLKVLQKAHQQCVLILGHNPGIAEFADQLAIEPPEHCRFHNYPSGATTIIKFKNENWNDIRSGTGKICDFVIPRELPET